MRALVFEPKKGEIQSEISDVDVNGNGSIGYEVFLEMIVTMRALGFVPKKKEIQKNFSDVDDDGSGTIGYEEFLKINAHKILNREPEDVILKAFAGGKRERKAQKVLITRKK